MTRDGSEWSPQPGAIGRPSSVNRTLSGNVMQDGGVNRFLVDDEMRVDERWLREYRVGEDEEDGPRGPHGMGPEPDMPFPTSYYSDAALRRLGVGVDAPPPPTPSNNNTHSPSAEVDASVQRMQARVERVDNVVDRLRSVADAHDVQADPYPAQGRPLSQGVLLDTPSHVTSFGGTEVDDTLDTTGGRTFQTSSEEDVDMSARSGKDESFVSSDSGGASNKSSVDSKTPSDPSSEERALDAAAQFLKDLSVTSAVSGVGETGGGGGGVDVSDEEEVSLCSSPNKHPCETFR